MSRLAKVLMFGWEFPPYISGGLGTACFGLTKSMVEQGASVTFIVPRASVGENTSDVNLIGGNQVDPLSDDELRQRIEMSEEHLKMIKVDAFLRPYQGPEDYYQAITELKKSSREELQHIYDNTVIDISGQYGPDLMAEVARYGKLGTRLAMREDFDVIHAHDWMCYMAGVEAKRQSGKPLVCHVHATEFDRSGEHPNPEVYNLERYGLDNADRVITVSHRTKDIVHQHYGVPLEKIRVVHNGVIKEKSVEKGQVKHAYDEKIVLFLGRITMQ
ncbi:MAG: glycosyltransferase, partial [Planctomycetes bacterium]|nr:glycosyltransferase [Planctomycetota bacterium]